MVIQPGQKIEVDLGGRGAKIAGRVILQGDIPQHLDLNYSDNYLIRRGSALPPTAELKAVAEMVKQGWTESLLRSSAGNSYLYTHESHFVRLSEKGEFLINGVLPGEYDFAISIYERFQGSYVDRLATKFVPVTVKQADVDRGQISMPVITIPVPERAKVGASLPEITLPLSNGKSIQLSKFHDQPLLLHGWAIWSKKSFQSLPQLKRLRTRFPDEKLTLIGINLDNDAKSAADYATSNELNWDQSFFVNDNYDVARNLGVNAAPTYLVVSKEGKLMLRSTDWEAAEAMLEKLAAP